MSDVTAGAVMTLVIPLALLVVVIAVWAIDAPRWLRLRGRGAGQRLPPSPPDA